MTLRQIVVGVTLAGSIWAGSAAAVVLTHDYQLNGNLNDELGGPALVSLGGSLLSTPGRYDFGANQGLRLTGGLSNTGGPWSIDFRASYTSLANTWKKLVDFQNLGSDNGLYFSNYGQGDRLEFWPYGPGGALGPDVVTTNTDYTIALTRSDTGILTGYVNGALQWSVTDASNYAVSASNILTFFTDDVATGQREAQGGSVDFIRIYDGILSAEEVVVLDSGGSVGSSVPEPGSIALLGLGLAGLGWTRRRKPA